MNFMMLAVPTVQSDLPAQTYQIQYSTPQVCGAELANQVTTVALGIARKVGEFCEEQNVLATQNGNARCPPLTCMSESKPGGTAPGTFKVIVTYGSEFPFYSSGIPSGVPSGALSGPTHYPPGTGSSSGGVISIPGGSIGSGSRPGSGSGTGQSLNISVELTLPLGRTPDQLTCTNPVSSAFPNSLTTELLQKMIANSEGCSK